MTVEVEGGRGRACSLRVFRGEQKLRAYIGFLWFFECAAEEPAAVAVQRGVDAVVAQTPELSGRLCEHSATGTVTVDYEDPPRAVAVERRRADCAYSELAEGAFSQSAPLFAGVPGLTPVLDGLPVLAVQIVTLREGGGLVVVVLCHHVLVDGTAAFAVAQRISLASSCSSLGEQQASAALWADRQVVEDLLRAYPPPADVADETKAAEIGPRPLAIHGEMQQRQIRITQSLLEALRSDSSSSATVAVLALLWRAWARALKAHGSQGTMSYAGGPVDMRALGGPQLQSYLGNFIQLLPLAATRAAILGGTLADVAALVRTNFGRCSVSLGGVRAMLEAPTDDLAARLAVSDTPLLAFSNIARLPFHTLDFGIATPSAVRMRALDAPHMVFAYSDGAGGILANIILPQSMFDALAADPELTRYARLT
ncbi:hypothetical protein H4R19_001461 [Coemansia spiralis]|nr:hypothetical protein H4R19_001461 [Coemansia spiralis]